MIKIDYKLLNSFKELGVKKAKDALSGYSEELVGKTIQKNFSFERMQSVLEASVKEANESTQSEFNESDMFIAPIQIPTFGANAVEPMKETKEVKKVVDLFTEKAETVSIETAKINEKIFVANLDDLLPPDFSPCFVPMGDKFIFYPLSYWIWDWVEKTPDWKERVVEYPRIKEHQFLYSLIYYINLYGSFTVRETRNGEYKTLI